ncbi:MAG: tRNA-(ms[2]io[6]A)-hydroxylase [Saprospiraceae bacterium]|nr:tRNA-(ms[2]io[6]A)-hydroxylase [Saprospiraceae bacterium]
MSYEIDNKRVLGLELPTDPRWVNMAEISLEDILTDHAFCELKAASQCISLISLYPHKKELVEQVSPVVTEEWGHFRMVLKELNNRGLQLGNQRKDLYVNELLKFQKKGGSIDDRLLEKLMTFALIEARSCERFRLLSLHIAEDKLKEFYHKFMVSEAGHYKMFLELAKLYFGEERALQRWREYLEYEAEVMKGLETRGDRMH